MQNTELFIADNLHLLGGQEGYIYEVVVSRMQYIHLQLENNMRIIGLSVPLSNARDVGEWLGANKHTIYNFSPAVRPVGLELSVQSFSIPHFPSLMIAMARPAYQAIIRSSPEKPVIVFVPGRKQVRSSAQDLLAAAVADDNDDRFLHADLPLNMFDRHLTLPTDDSDRRLLTMTADNIRPKVCRSNKFILFLTGQTVESEISTHCRDGW